MWTPRRVITQSLYSDAIVHENDWQDQGAATMHRKTNQEDSEKRKHRALRHCKAVLLRPVLKKRQRYLPVPWACMT